MSPLLTIFTLTLLAGMAMPIGALLASIKTKKSAWFENEFRHSITAFAGGALLSAVALVLVPEGVKNLSIITSSIYFILGGFAFMLLDITINKMKTSTSQLMAMLADFFPESLALGATFSINKQSALLLAILIALQNVPEGFNAFYEIKESSNYSKKKIIGLFFILAFCGPISGLTGYLWLASHNEIVSAIMLFASGSILYSIFQDIAPQVPLEKNWAPPMGAILGFVLGLVGYMLTI